MVRKEPVMTQEKQLHDVREYPTPDHDYIVGDTLSKMAIQAYECDGGEACWKRIHDANKERIRDPHKIPSGLVLYIPSRDPNHKRPEETEANTREYTTEGYFYRAGDTLSRIAVRAYGCDGGEACWKRLYEVNRDIIKNPSHIEPGWRLFIPPIKQ
jgi:nucleoid-associated protein YgaU